MTEGRQGRWTEDRLLRLAGKVAARTLTRLNRKDALISDSEGGSLLSWGKTFLPRHFRLAPSAMHEWLADNLQTAPRGAKINCIGPRGGAKSTIGSFAYVLRMAVERREPYIWIVSDTRAQACAHLENIKDELTNNRRLRRTYPEACGQGRVWRAGAVELRNGVQIEAFGTGQKVRGRRRGEHRPTLIVCDDLQNDAHIRSPVQRAASAEWFQGALLKAGTRRTRIINLATALHRDALAMALTRTPGWTSRTFRAIERWPENMNLWAEWEAIYCNLADADAKSAAEAFFNANHEAMELGAEVLWPASEDLPALMRMRCESGRAAFEREKQSNPLDPALCEWPDEYFAEHAWFDEWPSELRLRTIALDPSKGADARRGDYSAFVMLGVDPAGILYVEADLSRRPTPQIVADGVELVRKFKPDAFGTEANQFQELLGADFTDEFSRQGVLNAAPWGIDNRVNKLVRIRRLGPFLSARRVRFKTNSPGTELLVNQLRDFPLGDHDDGPDALEMAIRLAGELCESPANDGLGNRLVM